MSGAPLPPRLLDVLRGYAAGERAIDTAARLHVSPATVHVQRRELLARLGARNPPQAVAIAYRRGLLPGGEIGAE